MRKAYLRAVVRKEPQLEGMGIELFRLDAAEEVDVTPIEAESVDDESTTAIMRIYEDIGADWFTGEGITVKNFAEELSSLGEGIKRLNIHINSMGGDAGTAQAIYNLIADHPTKKTSYIDGIAASAATIIACAADEVIARTNTNYMVHLPWSVTIGNADDHRKAAEDLEAITEPIVAVYKAQVKDKISDEKIRQLMLDETWMTASEALEYGFVDQVRGKGGATAKVSSTQILCSGRVMNFAKYKFRNFPKFPHSKNRVKSDAKVTTPVSFAQTKGKGNMTKAQLKDEHPEIYAEVLAEERTRITALDAMGAPGLEALIAAAKNDGREPKDIAMEGVTLLRTELGKTQQLNALAKDAAVATQIKAGDAPLVKPQDDPGKLGANLLAAAFNARKPKRFAGANGN